MNILKMFKLKKGKGYIKFSSEEKKKMIKKAARGANLMQKDTIDKYYAIVNAA
jgi:hypothetical protein